ncbi:MAG: phosphotransferase, partial [Hyphomicrobiales bacterium]|nr:phosphotransferase [Hyphomicrobiales bacterium]
MRRLHGLAQDALTQYDIEVTRCVLASNSTNLIYHIYTETGDQFALRAATPGWRTLANLQAEVMWLDGLAQDTSLNVPQILTAADGNNIVTAKVAGVPHSRHAIMMNWIPGMSLDKRLTEKNLAMMGKLFARMHRHGKVWQPPDGFNAQRFDHIFARSEPDVLLNDSQKEVYTPHSLQIMGQIRSEVDAAYANLDPADLRIIHCDLWHGNIKLHQNQLYPFDFEDTIWGYRLHDIGMAMLDLLEDVGQERYEPLFSAFRQGYESIL